MKPIFEDERVFLKEMTGVDLPTDCWRDGSKIYLDCTQKIPLIQFKVENKKIRITKDNRNDNAISLPQQIKISKLIEMYDEEINEMWDYSVKQSVKMLSDYKEWFWVLSYSGGKDSVVLYEVYKEALKQVNCSIEWVINFANTSNDTADTYKLVKKLPIERLKILNPEVGFYPWIIKIKNYLVPTVLMRNCCSVYKEGQINKYYDKNANIVQVIGVRKLESSKRAKLQMIMDDEFQTTLYGSNNMSKNWIRFAPIIDWKEEHIWLYLLKNNIEFNRQYELGFNRCGCLVCPYQSDYVDLLIERHYPTLWKRWIEILKKNYSIYHILENKKWNIEEYINGKWKIGIGKVQELIQSKPTKEKIKIVSELQGISENMATKYFNKKCVCGKSLNPTELAMFYKTYGRYEDIVNDNRGMLCKKCFCKENGMKQKEYVEQVIRYRDEGCKLF